MLFAFFLPITLACVFPGTRDNVVTDYANIYPPGTVLNFKCENTYSIPFGQNGFPHRRVCQDNGSWSEDDMYCGHNVAMDLPLKTPDGYVDELAPLPSTFWEMNLRGSYDVHFVNLILPSFMKSPLNHVSLKISNGSNYIVCLFTDTSKSSPCHFIGAEKVEINSPFPLTIRRIEVIASNSGNWNPYPWNGRIYAKEFLFSSDRKTYQEAKRACKGSLLENPTEEDWAIMAKGMGPEPRWIGLIVTNNAWQWESGATLISSKIPSPPWSGQAIVLNKNNTWTVVNQFEEHYYICRLQDQLSTCSYPGIPAGGRISHQDANAARYECTYGYMMMGEPTRICEKATGKWLTKIPRCFRRI